MNVNLDGVELDNHFPPTGVQVSLRDELLVEVFQGGVTGTVYLKFFADERDQEQRKVCPLLVMSPKMFDYIQGSISGKKIHPIC